MNYRLWEIMERQGRTLKWLAVRTGYHYNYVRSVKSGQFPLTEEFKRKCEYALEIPADILFSLPTCSTLETKPVTI